MTKNEVRVLVMEEQKITSFDLHLQFEQQGFSVISESDMKNLSSALEDKTPFLLVASIPLLMSAGEHTFKKQFENCKMENFDQYHNTDTLVLSSEMSVLKKFSKPFHSIDVVNFVNEYLTTES